MKRFTAFLAAALGAVAVAAVPASANAPGGQGLVSFGTISCEGIGDVEIFGPRPEVAPTAFTTTGEHLVAASLSVMFTSTEGIVSTFSKSFGTKAGLATMTCTQPFEAPEGSGVLTAVVAIVPPG